MFSLMPADPGRVDLHEVDRTRLQQLLEDDPVRDVLAGRDPQRRDRGPDRGQAEDLVRAGRLLDPVRVERAPAP